MPNIRAAIVLCLLIVVAPAPGAAYRYHVHTYREADGLPNQSVYGIDQTDDGRIWLATRKGLIVYDGLRWENVSPAPVAGRGLRDVTVDSRGRIWITSLLTPPTVAWREDGAWRALPPPPVPSWGWEVSLLRVATDPSGEPRVIIATQDRHLLLWDGDRWRILTDEQPVGTIYGVLPQRDVILVAAASGLWSVGLGSGDRLEPVPEHRGRPCYALAARPGGGVWVVGEGYAAAADAAGEWVEYAFPPLNLQDRELGPPAAVDGSGGLYVGTSWKVIHFHPERGHELLDRDSGLASEGATDILVDREGNVWISSLRGVSKIVSHQLRTYDHRHGLLEDEVSAVLRLRDGRLLLGHDLGITVLEDPPRTHRFTPGALGRHRAMDLAQAADGAVWVAAGPHGLLRYDPDADDVWVRPAAGPQGSQFALLVAPDGTLWTGGQYGLGRIVDGDYAHVPLPEGGSGDQFVRRIVAAESGDLYVMTGRNGVYRRRDAAWRGWTTSATPGGVSTFCALERPDGTLWIGSADGVQLLGERGLEPEPELAPLLTRPVYAMTTDARGRVWFGTDEGVRIWDGATLTSVRVGDGLAGPEINRDALWRDVDDAIWVGTDRGVTRFDADYLSGPRALPLVEIVGFDVDGVRVPADQPLRRRGDIALLVAHFRGLSFVDEKQLRYRTWLEGFEDRWQPAAAAPLGELRYTNLAPGDYRFHVQAVAMHGERSDVAASAALRVVPPVWATWWFRGGLLVAAMAAVSAGAALITGRRHARRLEGLVHDRTSRLRDLEQAARAESARMRATLMSISDGVLAVDGDGRVVIANRAASALLGREVDELQDRRLEDLLPDLAAADLDAGVPVVAAPATVAEAGVLEATVAPLGEAPDGSTGRVIALRDLTDRRRLEEERARGQRLESLGVLAGGIAHDFNNLLTVILGHASILEGADELPAAEREAAAKIRLSSEKARTLTQQLLTFARGGEPKRTPTLLAPLVAAAVERAPGGAGARCRVELAPDLRPARIDAGQIGQALVNLLANADEAMGGGDGTITVAGRNLDAPPSGVPAGEYVELVVADQGPGVPAEARARIFEPFFTTKPDGSGLGLAVAYSIARRHGGRLTVRSARGGGAAFALVLPAAERPAALAPAPDRPTDRLSGRILVMDDESAIRDLVTRMLRALGCEVEAVADGDAAVAAWTAARDAGRPFDLAILDLTVPGGMGGAETLQALRAQQPDARAVVASGYCNDPVLADPPAFGFAGAIEKPFGRAELARVVGAALHSIV